MQAVAVGRKVAGHASAKRQQTNRHYNLFHSFFLHRFKSCFKTTNTIKIIKIRARCRNHRLRLYSAELRQVPITIEQIKGDDAAQTSDEGNVYYILFNKRVLPPAQLLDREGWKVVHCTSEYTPGEGNPKTGWAKDVLDGNPASYWTYNFKASVGPVVYVPLYFVFDMGKEVTVRGVRITARTKADGALNNPPGDITIETARTITGDGMENDADWTYSERFTGTKPDEGIMSHSLHNSVYLGEIQRARYIRFTLHMSWNSGSSVKPTPMTYKGGTFAEFEVWGNLEELDLD